MYEELGIIGKNIDKAGEVMGRLHRDLGLDGSALTPVESGEVERLLQCIIAGQIDQLWLIEGDGSAIHLTTKKKRELSSSTVVANPKLVAGTPFDLQIQTQKGDLETLHLVQGITDVNPKWLQALAPHLFSVRQGKTYFDSQRGVLATRQLVRFNGRTIEGGGVPVTQRTARDKRLFSEMYGTWIYEQLETERRYLQRGYNRRIPMIPLRQIQQKVRAIVGKAISVEELSDYQREDLVKVGKMQTYLGDVFMAKLGAHRKDSDRHADQPSRRSWRPQHKRKYDRRRGR
jgi:hypothetical protein